jgi:hypothetical protein
VTSLLVLALATFVAWECVLVLPVRVPPVLETILVAGLAWACPASRMVMCGSAWPRPGHSGGVRARPPE